MPKHKTKLIINPNADLGRAWRLGADLNRVVAEFGGADWSGTVYPTHATELAIQAADEGYETVVSIGGDGTTHEVINGLMQIPAERRPRLGIAFGVNAERWLVATVALLLELSLTVT